MDASTSSVLANPLVVAALTATLLSTAILLWFLIVRPPLDRSTKLLLLAGMFVLPTASALAGNLVGFEATTKRSFCGSCHVMEPYTDDSADPKSTSLASLHARNSWFGGKNCYTCHADYEMFGTVVTKLSGLSHVYYYYFTKWGDMSKGEFLQAVRISKPFTNRPCMQCHSTTTAGFARVRDHKSALGALRAGEIGCASKGCHGPAHPFSKIAKGEDLSPPPLRGPVEVPPPAEPMDASAPSAPSDGGSP